MQKNGVRIEHVKDKLLLELMIFLLLFLTSGFMVCNDIISSAMTIGLWLVLFVVLLSGIKLLNRNSVVCYAAVVACMTLSMLVNNENIWTLSIRIFSFFVVMCITNVYTLNEFKMAFINVVVYLAVVSLVGFLLFSCIPILQNLFVVRNSANHLYSNLILYVHPKGFSRNMGIFWEPGAYQTFLCLALLLETLDEHMSMKRVLILILTIISTLSTTGYIALAIILPFALVKKTTSRTNKRIIAILLLIIVIFTCIFWDELLDTSTDSPFGKIVSYSGDKNANKKVTTTSSRINSVIQPFYAFLSSPIFGLGYEGLNTYTYVYTHNMNTCTVVNWFAVYGIGFGLTMLYCYYRFSKRITASRFQLVTVMVVLFIITGSENYVDNPFFIMLAMYGVSNSVGERRYANVKHQLL